MFDLARTSGQLKGAVMTAVVITALAYCPPLYLAQHIDGLLLDGYTSTWHGDRPAVVVVDPSRVDALALIRAGTRATFLGPNLLALGPLESGLWTDTLPWLLALAVLAALFAVPRRRRPLAWAATICAVPVLLALGAGSYLTAGVWVPVVGPLVLVLSTGILTLRRRPWIRAAGQAAAPEPEEALRLLQRGQLERAWLAYSELAATRANLSC